ncbi:MULTISPECIES: DUF4139 domain-containing protein [unclassified Corallococcus]|uniref:DUF4139 domain-containing protein n=1 Tax=unclassified Corallococcus TaxID=2685029 RepID=UPI001A8D0BEB|nr:MULTISPECIES: DUF4139 domain-containing protein [unclassified Corallococcus]MBN9684638.1 DUF4139 domain-containing protein [Corallococcus sp. NCSPR001]WAS83891.1 DUF4139 domain-containing protein [Corallococcus sp. NCRR]
MRVVPSVLESVTVHAEGALCTRAFVLSPENGHLPGQVRIDGLPLSLRTGSLRARVVEGPPDLLVRDLKPTFDVRVPPESELPAEQHALEAAEATLAAVHGRLERVRAEIAALRGLTPTWPAVRKGHPPREAPLSSMLALTGFVEAELAELQAQELDLARQHRDATNELELRRRRVQELSSARSVDRARLFRAALLTLSGPIAANADARLVLEYAVAGARWVPTYDLRLPRTLEEGTLRMRAAVVQRTGEDWMGVRLAVSTASLERRAEVPELKSLRIGRSQPVPARSGWREPAPGLEELFAGYDALHIARPEPVPPKPQPPPMPVMESAYEQEERYKEAASFGSAPGAAPSVSAPPPPMAPAPKASGAFLGGARPSRNVTSGGPAPSMPPPRGGGGMDRLRSKKRAVEEDDFDGAPMADELLDEEGGAGDELGRAAGVEPADRLFDYDSLTLASAASPAERGRLRPRSALVSQAMLSITSVNVQVEVVRLEAQAFVIAESVNSVAPPTWSVPPHDSARHFDARFDAEAVADVPSDGAWHTVPMLTVPLELKAEYVCVPSVEPRVFRTVRLDNASPHPLLAGPVDVTLGDEFLMTSPMPTLGPGETQRLGLGVEEALQVARNTRFDETSGGMFGNSTVLTHHVSVEVANHLSRAANIAISERISAVPESQKDIKVEEAEVAPPWQKPTPLPGEEAVEGERVWRVSVPAGEKRSMKATWVVKLPASKMLNGGNRRT